MENHVSHFGTFRLRKHCFPLVFATHSCSASCGPTAKVWAERNDTKEGDGRETAKTVAAKKDKAQSASKTEQGTRRRNIREVGRALRSGAQSHPAEHSACGQVLDDSPLAADPRQMNRRGRGGRGKGSSCPCVPCLFFLLLSCPLCSFFCPAAVSCALLVATCVHPVRRADQRCFVSPATPSRYCNVSSHSRGLGSSRSTLTSPKQPPPRALRGRTKTPDPLVAMPVAWAGCGRSFGSSHTWRQTTPTGRAEICVFVIRVSQCVFLLVLSPVFSPCVCSCSLLRMLFFSRLLSSVLHICLTVLLSLVFFWESSCVGSAFVPRTLSPSCCLPRPAFLWTLPPCCCLPRPAFLFYPARRLTTIDVWLSPLGLLAFPAPLSCCKKICRHGVAAPRPGLCPHSMKHKSYALLCCRAAQATGSAGAAAFAHARESLCACLSSRLVLRPDGQPKQLPTPATA